jgi:hypothetical protein
MHENKPRQFKHVKTKPAKAQISVTLNNRRLTTLRRIARVRGRLSGKQGCGGLRGVGVGENVGRGL